MEKKELKKPVTISLTESEKKRLTEKAKKNNRTLSNFLLWAALNA